MAYDELVILTGANGHFGRALSKGLSNKYIIASVVRDKNNIEIKDSDNNFIFNADLSKEKDLKNLKEKILNFCNSKDLKLHGIINNAYWLNKLEGIDFKNDSYNGIYRSQINLILEFLPYMNKESSIVNISSMYANVAPNPDNYESTTQINPLEYGAMKSALQAATRWLSANYCKKYKIRFNSISFGPFPSKENQTENFNKRLSNCTHIGRIGMPSEVVGPVDFLLSSASSYVTGSNIVVDGGWTSW